MSDSVSAEKQSGKVGLGNSWQTEPRFSSDNLLVEWLVGWLFWAKRPFETIFQSISGRLPKRGRKRRKDR